MTDLERLEILLKDFGIEYTKLENGVLVDEQWRAYSNAIKGDPIRLRLPADAIGLYVPPNAKDSYGFFSIVQFSLDGKFVSIGYWE